MSDLPLDEAALDRAKKRIEHGDWPADNTLHALVAQSRAALTLRARVAELEAELAITQKYADDCGSLLTRATTERDAAYSHAAKLREALVKADAMIRKLLAGAVTDTGADETGAAIGAALATTPAASLAAVRASVWEEARALVKAEHAACWHADAMGGAGACDRILRGIERALAAQEVKP